jgi:hypothetical protein
MRCANSSADFALADTGTLVFLSESREPRLFLRPPRSQLRPAAPFRKHKQHLIFIA